MRQKALLLEYFTVSWNVLEGVIALIAGMLASSIALVGFGLDSYIEVASAVVLIWRLRKQENEEEEEQAEQRAILVVGVTFIALALYVTYESITKLIFHEQPAESLVGILLAIVSLIVMPLLAWRKREVAARIQSRALAADALETLACSYLSFTLLLGLGLNAWLGWWWADPLAGLMMVFFLLREGWEALAEGWKGPEERKLSHSNGASLK